ncbi:DUF3231 family protein [Bacillus alkalicellulosilyticus]|uniref:DUF3231 family protein n=1 Tax=Alkalihalobacterium alkalicellulosilyticum TaxID=1912214 RepID=UPI000996D33D|nr:DUF3231 family protein [Bacillus alkalicellulosilyticus]
MPNVLEAVKSAFNTIVDDEPPIPLNIIEASSCWFYYGLVNEAIAFQEAGLNTTNDDEVKGILQDAIKMCMAQSKELKSFMLKEGIPLPPTSETKPKSDHNEIPTGVKLTDDEITNGVALKTVAMNVQAATAAAECVRTDIGSMWVQFLMDSITYGITLKTKMRKRGWAKIPPPYAPPGK